MIVEDGFVDGGRGENAKGKRRCSRKLAIRRLEAPPRAPARINTKPNSGKVRSH